MAYHNTLTPEQIRATCPNLKEGEEFLPVGTRVTRIFICPDCGDEYKASLNNYRAGRYKKCKFCNNNVHPFQIRKACPNLKEGEEFLPGGVMVKRTFICSCGDEYKAPIDQYRIGKHLKCAPCARGKFRKAPFPHVPGVAELLDKLASIPVQPNPKALWPSIIWSGGQVTDIDSSGYTG